MLGLCFFVCLLVCMLFFMCFSVFYFVFFLFVCVCFFLSSFLLYKCLCLSPFLSSASSSTPSSPTSTDHFLFPSSASIFTNFSSHSAASYSYVINPLAYTARYTSSSLHCYPFFLINLLTQFHIPLSLPSPVHASPYLSCPSRGILPPTVPDPLG